MPLSILLSSEFTRSLYGYLDILVVRLPTTQLASSFTSVSHALRSHFWSMLFMRTTLYHAVMLCELYFYSCLLAEAGAERDVENRVDFLLDMLRIDMFFLV